MRTDGLFSMDACSAYCDYDRLGDVHQRAKATGRLYSRRLLNDITLNRMCMSTAIAERFGRVIQPVKFEDPFLVLAHRTI